jgi:hypothetical protein
MLLRRRPPGLDVRPATTTQGFEHLDAGALAVLRWLNANEVDYVLVGAVARALRGDREATGPVSIVPAPYGRNHERLARALAAEQARQRAEPADAGQAGTVPVKLTAEKLARGPRWRLRCGEQDLDVESVIPTEGAAREGVSGYQELLYESARYEPAEGIAVEVASPEDIEHYAHVARTGSAPSIRITRAERAVSAAG